jgi:hypothetical protein
MCIGILGEAALAMGPAIAPYLERIVPVVMNGLKSPDYNSRHNSLFCIGVLCQVCVDVMRPHFMPFLSSLHPHFVQRDNEDRGVVDNAAGAVARMVVADAGTSLPLKAILPTWLAVLPAQYDIQECATCTHAMMFLTENSPAAVMECMSPFLGAVARTLASHSVDDSFKSALCNFVKSCYMNHLKVLEVAVSSLPNTEQEIMRKIIT